MADPVKSVAGSLYTELNSLCIGLTGSCSQLVDAVLNDNSDPKLCLSLITQWSAKALALHKFIVAYQTTCVQEKNQLLVKSSVVSNVVIKSIHTIREIIASKPPIPQRTTTCQQIKSDLAVAIKGVGFAATLLAKEMARSSLTGSQGSNISPSTSPNPMMTNRTTPPPGQGQSSSPQSFTPPMTPPMFLSSSGDRASRHFNSNPLNSNPLASSGERRSSYSLPEPAFTSLEMANKCLDFLLEIIVAANERDTDKLAPLVKELVGYVNQLLVSYPSSYSQQCKSNLVSLMTHSKMVANSPSDERLLTNFLNFREKIQEAVASYLPPGISHPALEVTAKPIDMADVTALAEAEYDPSFNSPGVNPFQLDPLPVPTSMPATPTPPTKPHSSSGSWPVPGTATNNAWRASRKPELASGMSASSSVTPEYSTSPYNSNPTSPLANSTGRDSIFVERPESIAQYLSEEAQNAADDKSGSGEETVAPLPSDGTPLTLTAQEEEFVRIMKQIARKQFGQQWESISNDARWKFEEAIKQEIFQYKTAIEKDEPEAPRVRPNFSGASSFRTNVPHSNSSPDLNLRKSSSEGRPRPKPHTKKSGGAVGAGVISAMKQSKKDLMQLK